ncbi:MAG: protein kinase [Microbacteriaceae bacterium]
MREIAGYEIVRKLGSGGRSEVYLGHPPRGAEGAADAVAVKVFGRGATATSIDTEIAALAAARSEHVVALIDVATLADGGCALILERLPEGQLSRLLRVRTQLAAGEAVTIVASLVRGLNDLHSSGFAHGRLTGSTVLFGAAGRPVLIGLGHAERLEMRSERGAARGLNPIVLEDYRRLAVLAQSVCDRVDSAHRCDQLNDFVAACSALADGRAEPDLERLEELVFAIAQPAPVRLRFAEPTPEARFAEPLRLPGAARKGRGAVAEQRGRESPFPAIIATLIDGRPLRMLRERLLCRLRSKRRQVWFACALSCALLITLITLLPTGATSRAGPAGRPELPASSAQRPPSQTSQPPRNRLPARTSSPPADTDDPVAAALALLRIRDGCLRSRTLACLDQVDQRDSAIHDADRQSVGTAAGTPDPVRPGLYDPGRFAGFAASLIQRTGNSALVALAVAPGTLDTPAGGEAASAFLIKGEGGWRLREIFAMQPIP